MNHPSSHLSLTTNSTNADSRSTTSRSTASRSTASDVSPLGSGLSPTADTTSPFNTIVNTVVNKDHQSNYLSPSFAQLKFLQQQQHQQCDKQMVLSWLQKRRSSPALFNAADFSQRRPSLSNLIELRTELLAPPSSSSSSPNVLSPTLTSTHHSDETLGRKLDVDGEWRFSIFQRHFSSSKNERRFSTRNIPPRRKESPRHPRVVLSDGLAGGSGFHRGEPNDSSTLGPEFSKVAGKCFSEPIAII